MGFDPTMSASVYVMTLTSITTIACLGIGVTGWMLKDTWKDWGVVKLGSTLFLFRLMKAMAGMALFLRTIPEVLYLQIYADKGILPEVYNNILLAKHLATNTALWFVLGWLITLVIIYPPVFTLISEEEHIRVMQSKRSLREKLVRPLICFICILVISGGFAYTKAF